MSNPSEEADAIAGCGCLVLISIIAASLFSVGQAIGQLLFYGCVK